MARTYETTVEIDAPAGQVWFVMTDVEAMPSWTTSMTEVMLEQAGPLAVGSRARISQPKLSTATWTVTELVPGESWSWESHGGGVRNVGRHVLEPGSDTGSVTGTVTVRLSVEMHGALSAFVWLVAGGLVRRYVQAEAYGLKTECESRRR